MEPNLRKRASQPLSSGEIKEWSRRASLEAYEPAVEKGIVGRLYTDICRLYKEVLRSFLDAKDAKHPSSLYRRLEGGYTCLLTWGSDYGVDHGKLDRVLLEAKRLQLSTVKVMISICATLTDELIPLMDPENTHLQKIKSMASILSNTMEDASLILQDTMKDFDTLSDDSIQNSSWTTNPALEEVVGSLKTDVECLMDMGPRFHDPLPSTGIDPAMKSATKPDQSSWDPVKHFSERIRSKFPDCYPVLVVACGKAVYEALIRLYEARETVSATGIPERRAKEPLDSGFFSSSSHTAGGPQQQGQPGEHAYPSGASLDGGSIAQTILSFAADDGTRRARFPSQPKDVGVGEVFPCIACGKQVAKARSSRAWKRHLLSDLRPWICCQVACPCDRKAFNSRNSWLAHLQAQHNVHPDWDDESCPFCLESIPQGGYMMIRHVELHLQEISLMALSSPADDDEKADSNESDWASHADYEEDEIPESPTEKVGLISNILDHPVYKSTKPMDDGLWHCPWEGEVECSHEPTILKCDFDGFIAQHLDSFTCKVQNCMTAGRPFSTTECLRLHEQEIHGVYKGADRPFLCTSKGCGRSIPGNGFANRWVLEEHIRVVHRDIEGLPPLPPENEG